MGGACKRVVGTGFTERDAQTSVYQEPGRCMFKRQLPCQDSDSEGLGWTQTWTFLASTRKVPCERARGHSEETRAGGRGGGTERRKVRMEMESKPSRCPRATITGTFQKPKNYDPANSAPKKEESGGGGGQGEWWSKEVKPFFCKWPSYTIIYFQVTLS